MLTTTVNEKRKSIKDLPRANPGSEKLFKMLEATMKRHRYQADALIEVLHNAQELFGFLEPDLLAYIAYSLKLPPSRVYGVATFYHFFSLKPKGAHTCVVCMGTACYVKGANDVLAKLEKSFGLKAGDTTADGKFSVLTARCLGACGLAPAVVFDGAVAGRVTPEQALSHVKGWIDNGSN